MRVAVSPRPVGPPVGTSRFGNSPGHFNYQSRRSATGLCTASAPVLLLLTRYCGSSFDARTVRTAVFGDFLRHGSFHVLAVALPFDVFALLEAFASHCLPSACSVRCRNGYLASEGRPRTPFPHLTS